MESESIADRLLREEHEAKMQQQQQSRELAQFLEGAIDNATPKVMNPAAEGLKKVIGDAITPLQRIAMSPGRRTFRMTAYSKNGVEAVLTAQILGQGPIVDNPHDVNFVWKMDVQLTIPGRARKTVPISPYRAHHGIQPVPSADFIASTLETALKEMLR